MKAIAITMTALLRPKDPNRGFDRKIFKCFFCMIVSAVTMNGEIIANNTIRARIQLSNSRGLREAFGKIGREMRHERVVEDERQYRVMWDKGIIDDNNMLNYTSPAMSTSYWDNWTDEEKNYYSHKTRFPARGREPNYYDPSKDPNRKF
jgi:hypothetical protein